MRYGSGMCIVRYLLCNCVYHPERGSAMNLMKTPAQWESCGHRTAHKANEGVKRAKLLVACY